eukprot:COSAG06_NODE_4230_length_4447_cov_1.412603_6_plen_83_part_00
MAACRARLKSAKPRKPQKHVCECAQMRMVMVVPKYGSWTFGLSLAPAKYSTKMNRDENTALASTSTERLVSASDTSSLTQTV